MGNTEVPFDEIRGHDDVVLMEKYIKNKINRDALYAYVENITIINWKRFNT
jgi:hypothetical protein